MSSKRVFFIMIALVSLLCITSVGAVFFGNSMLSKQAKQLLSLRLEDKLIEEQQLALLAASKEIEKYADLEKIAKSIVPQDKDQAKTVLEINNIAQQSGIKLSSITFSGSNLGSAAPKPAEGDDSGSGSATPTAPPLTQVKPVEGIAGVYALELNISPQPDQGITYYRLLDFLGRLEKNRRTAHVVKINVIPQTNNTISFTLTLNAYLKP